MDSKTESSLRTKPTAGDTIEALMVLQGGGGGGGGRGVKEEES